MLKTLYLIRHAHPQQNTGIAYDRVPGPPLSDAGKEEANAAALYLGQCNIQQLYASPLERTQQTAQAIADRNAIPLQTEPLLAEHRLDEQFDKVKERVGALMARVDAENAEIVGFVTHGSPIKALLQMLSGGKLDLSKTVFDSGNHAPWAGVWQAERVGEAWSLELVFTPAMVKTL
jgi:broad specificity phosphatase PhoE